MKKKILAGSGIDRRVEIDHRAPGRVQFPLEAPGAALDQIRRGYRRFAPVYDFVFGASLHHGRHVALKAADCRPGERILEIGVGTGLALPLYPRHVRVTGIDVSREMLDKALARVRRRRLTQVEALLQMDAQALSFPDASFDKIVVLYALAGLPDPVRAAREMMRVCRPGGALVIANHFRSNGALLRTFERLLEPIYRVLRYRTDLDLEEFLAATQFDVRAVERANLFGYCTILVCRNRS